MPQRARDAGQAAQWVPLAVGAGLVVGFVLLLGLFGDDERDPIAIETPTTSTSTLPDTTASTVVTTTVPALATTTTTASPRPTTSVAGTLLDGTPFLIHTERPMILEPQGISGVVVLDRRGGTSPAAGILDVQRGRIDAPSVGAGAVSLPAGDWTVTLRIYPALQTELAATFPDTVANAFTEIRAPGRLPAFELVPPLRWARDDEVPSVMEVDYGWFSVRRGCPPEALRCSERRSVALMAGVGDGDAPDFNDIFIGSPAPRPPGDPSYLDPGPLSPRMRAQVMWTGAEMIVFGGTDTETSGRNNLTDGAAYHVATDTWRTIAAYPAELRQPSDTRAVWGDGVMFVVDADGLAAYDPSTDSWEILGPGVVSPRQVVWIDPELYVWSEQGLFVATPGEPFTRLPDPGFGSWRPWEGVLLDVGGEPLLSVLASVVCGGRYIARLGAGGWEFEETPSLATADHADCSLANQIGVIDGQVVIWQEEGSPAAALVDGGWIEIAGPPVPGYEGVGGSVALDDHLLVPVGDRSALYDPARRVWLGPFHLDGIDADTMVWTGSEVLSWSGSCCESVFGQPTNDAWRWTPPPELFDE